MMPAEILDDLRRHDVQLFLEGDRLRCKTKKGAYTAEFRARVDAHRAALIAFLTVQPKPAVPPPTDREVRVAEGNAPALSVPIPPEFSVEGMSPADHLASLGGHGGAFARFGIEIAHVLWDSARLWERDRDTATELRWARQYCETWAKASRPAGDRPNS